MTLSLAEVEYIALLARLRLTEDEKRRYQVQLSAILDHIARLQELDTSGIPPTTSILPARGALRTDEAQPGLSLPNLLRNAPDVLDDQFRVPPVLE